MADLVSYVFEQVPGIQLRYREFLVPDKTSELDLVFKNQPKLSGLFDGVTLHMECKNERRKISADHVRVFASKLRDRNQPVGVTISRTGLARKPDTKMYAHGVISSELAAGRSIVVLAQSDLAGLADTSG